MMYRIVIGYLLIVCAIFVVMFGIHESDRPSPTYTTLQMGPSHEMVAELMQRASDLTGLPVPDRHPRIEMRSRCFLNRLVRGDFLMECPKPGDLQVAAAQLRGLIILGDDWTGDTLIDRARLLHELVHYMQYAAGHDDMAGCLKEKQAYATHFMYMKQEGSLDPIAETGLNPLAVKMLTSCID